MEVKRTFFLTLMSQKRKPKPMRYLDSPCGPLIFPSSGGVGLRPLQFCKNTRGLFIFPGGSVSKESACNMGDLGCIPGLGRSPGRGHGSPLQYSCLDNPMNRGGWQATGHGCEKVGHDEQLSTAEHSTLR